MATIIGGGFALNTGVLDVSSLIAGTVVVANAGQFTTTDSGITDSLYGTFTYQDGLPSGGVLTGLQETYLGDLVFSITGLSIPVADARFWFITGATSLFVEAVLAGSDSIRGSSMPDILDARGGADTFYAGGGGDTIFGGVGDDLLFGESGDDQVHVGFGSDSGFGGVGNDTLVSIQSTGVAYLRGDEGNDSLLGGTGFVDLNGNMGNDTVTGGYGDDWVVGGKDNDLINGAWGHDIVYGNMGDDTCYGGDMNDTLRGGQGNDLLFGENGNDWIWGDRGDDTISGSGGADTFIVFAGSGLDRVVDFNATTGDRVRVEFGAYTVRQDGADTVVDLGAGDSLVLVGVQLSTLPDGWLFAG